MAELGDDGRRGAARECALVRLDPRVIDHANGRAYAIEVTGNGLRGIEMPVTAKLSRGFYEKLGDEVANELVEWFNQVDATYRADLRE